MNALRLLDLLYNRPLVDVSLVRDQLGITFATANKLIEQLALLGLVREVTGRKRDRIFRFEPYLRLFEDEESRRDAPGTMQETARLLD